MQDARAVLEIEGLTDLTLEEQTAANGGINFGNLFQNLLNGKILKEVGSIFTDVQNIFTHVKNIFSLIN